MSNFSLSEKLLIIQYLSKLGPTMDRDLTDETDDNFFFIYQCSMDDVGGAFKAY